MELGVGDTGDGSCEMATVGVADVFAVVGYPPFGIW
jgi:hypothetical protein